MTEWIGSHFPAVYWDKLLTRIVEGMLQSVKIIVLYVVLRFLIVRVIRRIGDPIASRETDPVAARRIRTLTGVLANAMLYLLAFITILLTLQAFGVNMAALITAAGMGSLAVGFGAQKLVKDIISGFFMMLENQLAVGETVTIGSVTGTVSEIGLRTTRLQDAQGKLYIFSNGDISLVCNHSRGQLTVPLEISVASETDLSEVARILDEEGAKISEKYQLKSPYKCQGVSAFEAGKVTVKVVGSVSQSKQDAVLQELRKAIVDRFQSENIKLV